MFQVRILFNEKERNYHFRFFLCKLVLGAILFNLSACTSHDKTAEKIGLNFNIPHYLNSEVSRLNGLRSGVIKKINLNNEKDSLIINTVNWTKELELFAAIDLNKAAWKDHFLCDTLRVANTVIVTYKAKINSIPVRQVKLIYFNRKLESLRIVKQSDNFIVKSSSQLIYQPSSGYSYKSFQSILGLLDENYFVEATFQNKSLKD